MRPLVEEEIRRKSRISAATSLGRILEKLAPAFLGLLDSEEVRALYVGGALPVDYILVSREGIRFVEVKTGKDPNRLSPKEREFRDLVQSGRVSWELVHFPTEEREEDNGAV
jgi:predicted Holliday junction resolvase-like endonuclease